MGFLKYNLWGVLKVVSQELKVEDLQDQSYFHSH